MQQEDNMSKKIYRQNWAMIGVFAALVYCGMNGIDNEGYFLLASFVGSFCGHAVGDITYSKRS